jgi:phosphatidylinositol alpha 1,6-mannosyltransferase
MSELLGQGFHDRLAVWSRGVDARRFHPAHYSTRVRQELAPGAETIILYVGRIAAEKGIDLLLRAFARIRAGAGTRLALVLVGDGPLRPALQRRREPGVRFLGYRSGPALSAAFASADIFAFPSDTETFGNVVLEGMASGLPVIGVDRGGVRDLVQPDRTGLLVPAGDPERFADALHQMAVDPWLRARMGAAGRRDAVRRSWADVLDSVLSTYQRVRQGTATSGCAGHA